MSFDGDVAHGQFLTQIAGKDVWVTLAGHLGSKDGYATFDPTEFKVGDLNVPVSLVNDALQKKLSEQRDRLKLPDNVGGMKSENGELVMTQMISPAAIATGPFFTGSYLSVTSRKIIVLTISRISTRFPRAVGQLAWSPESCLVWFPLWRSSRRGRRSSCTELRWLYPSPGDRVW